MIEIDVDAVDAGVWFPYQDSHFDTKKGEWVFDPPPEGDDVPKVRVRLAIELIAKRVRSRKKESEFVFNPKTRSMERISYVKELSPEESEKEMADMWDYSITGLVGFQNKSTGAVIECTRENKLRLMNVPAFDRFIGHCWKILDGTEKQQLEASEKN